MATKRHETRKKNRKYQEAGRKKKDEVGAGSDHPRLWSWNPAYKGKEIVESLEREREVHTAREIRLEHLFSWLQLSHLAAIVCRSAQNSAPTVRIRGHKARADACAYRARLVLYQLATNTAIPDDKAERVAGVRGQPGPVAGVQPISDWQPAGHFARSTRTIVFCLRLLVRRTSMNCTSKSRDRPCSPTGCSEFLFASTDHRASRSIATVGVAFVGSTLLFVRVYDSHT